MKQMDIEQLPDAQGDDKPVVPEPVEPAPPAADVDAALEILEQ